MKVTPVQHSVLNSLKFLEIIFCDVLHTWISGWFKEIEVIIFQKMALIASKNLKSQKAL